MRLFFLFVFVLTVKVIFPQSPTYTNLIRLNTDGSHNISRLYLSYQTGDTKFTDSFTVKPGTTLVTKTISQPVAAELYSDNPSFTIVPVFLAGSQLNVTAKNNSFELEKDELQNEFLTLTANDRIRPSYFPLYGELNAKNDTAGLRKISVLFDSLKEDDKNKAMLLFRKNPSSLISLFAFSRFSPYFENIIDAEPFFQQLPAWAKESPDGKNISLKIEGAKFSTVNAVAKDFELPSVDGSKVALKDFKGKYVFIDFWASWCVPCRKEHPGLINLYESLRSKPFTIVSVSLDTDGPSWRAAIKKDKITWTQISDLKGFQSRVALEYGVQAIPANFLISPSGIIIAKNIKPELLSVTLEKLLK